MFGIRGISPLFWALRLHREEGANPQRFFLQIRPRESTSSTKMRYLLDEGLVNNLYYCD